MNINPALISKIKSTFKKKEPKTDKTRPCRIMLEDEFITTGSNKTVWRNIGFAKSALLNHFTTYVIPNDTKSCKLLISMLVSEGYIKFIEVDIEDFSIQKKN